LKDDEIKSANHEFETISVSDVDTYKNYLTTSNREWIEIKDPAIVDLILDNYGDQFSRRILQHVTLTPMTSSDILRLCGIPQTSGYRKILAMIDNHLLTPFDTAIGKRNGRITNRYISTFRNIQIEINEKIITVRARLNSKL
jgi:hypothetical protein